MSPIPDPDAARRRMDMLEATRAEGERAARLAYIIPTVILGIGLVTMCTICGMSGDDEVSGVVIVGIYFIITIIQLIFGVAGLWLACTLWLGGAGPLGLAILRLACIYVATDVVRHFTGSLMFVSWIIATVVYVGMLMWLFELEPTESIMLAIITWLLKIFVGAALIFSGMSIM